MARPTELKDLVANLPFFADLTDAEIDVILPLCRVTEGRDEDHIIREGEPVKNLYILLAGEVAIFKKRADGSRIFLSSVGKDDVLGELSFLQSVSASATAQAKAPFRALAIDQQELQRLLLTHLNIAAKLYKKLALVASRRLSALLGQHL